MIGPAYESKTGDDRERCCKLAGQNDSHEIKDLAEIIKAAPFDRGKPLFADKNARKWGEVGEQRLRR